MAEDVTQLYVVGGRQRAPRPVHATQKAFDGYDLGLVLRVDVASGEVATALEYVTPDEVLDGHESAIALQASTIEDGHLYTCTEIEALVFSLPRFELVHHVSLPFFNDVHHVRRSLRGNILVANAGLEMVVEVTPEGEVVEAWNVLGEDPWANVDRSTDYRPLSTKPHRSHPNYVFYVGNELWATRFQQGDAVSLTSPGRTFEISDKRIHDGVLHAGRLYFTVVNGEVVVVDANTLAVVEVLDLSTFHDDRALLGWCRGVLVDGPRLWVGFSRIRPTQARENVAWIARGFRKSKPTHLACYDLEARECLTEIDLEPFGLSALFSILDATPSA